ncbi:major facilitator superfamily domain-containing protein [Xylaria intraflava]|nr:major facilitator superfamily domain-containing protein [Xylaria intraflava]
MDPVALGHQGPSPAQERQESKYSYRRFERAGKNTMPSPQADSNRAEDGPESEEMDTDVIKEADIDRSQSSSGRTSSQLSPSTNSDSQIEYLYLTFDSQIPGPEIPPGTLQSEIPRRPDDSHYVNPMQWPKARKGATLALSCIASFLTAYAAGAYSPPAELIAEELHITHEVSLLGVTTFCLGFAYAPMVLAPFSEFTGRYSVFAVAGIGFTVFQAICGVVTTTSGMLFARFFEGIASSVYSTIASGVLSDIYEKEDRNTPMALFCGFVLAGTGVGPLFSSIIVGETDSEGQMWKWVFWHQVIVDFILTVAICVFFKESRGSVVLSRKAKALNKWYDELEAKGFVGVRFQSNHLSQISDQLTESREKQPYSAVIQPASNTETPRLRRIRWKTKADEERGSLVTMLSISLTRPFHFLFTEPIVFFFSLWVSFAWAILYLMFSSITLVFNQQYGFSIQQSGYVFSAMVVGCIIATFVGIYQDDLLKHPNWRCKSSETDRGDDVAYSDSRVWAFLRRKFPAESSESRLYFTCFTSVFLPAGLFLFGFSARPSVHWIVPAIGVGVSTAGIYSIYLATFNYFADSYREYASSATAAQSFCRNVLAGVFPLVTSLLWTNLGEAKAGAILGSIAALFTAVPWALVFYGETIRRKSKYAITLDSGTAYR